MMMIKKFLSFTAVGTLCVIVDLLFFNLFFIKLDISFFLSRAFASFIAIIFSFQLNRSITFKAKHKPVRQQFPKHLSVYVSGMIVNVLVSSAIFYTFGNGNLSANIASASGIIAGFPINFFGSLLWTFKKEGESIKNIFKKEKKAIKRHLRKKRKP